MGLFDDAKQLFDDMNQAGQDMTDSVNELGSTAGEIGEQASGMLDGLQPPEINMDEIINDVLNLGDK